MPTKRYPDEGRLIQLVYYGYVAGSAVARWIPERVAYGLASALGEIGARTSRKRSAVARNLARITGFDPSSRRIREVVRRAYRSYATYWLETFRLVREDRDFFVERFTSDTEWQIDRVLERGKGAIVVVGHLGNWDAAGAWAAARGRRLVTVAEVLKPRRMFDFFADHRAALGMTIYPAAKGATARLIEEVEAGAVVAILGDRDLKGTGIVAEFFGEPATFPRGPSAVAIATGVPLLVAGVFSRRFPDGRHGWYADISDPIEVPSPDVGDRDVVLTHAFVQRLEKLVAQAPEEWHVFQPFWPADRRSG